MLTIRNGILIPKDPARFYANFPAWAGKKIKLINWVNDTTLRVSIEGRKTPVNLSVLHFLTKDEGTAYLAMVSYL